MNTPTTPAAPTVDLAHVLVPLDGSELALQAMPTARALGERFDADVHTVTVAARGHDADRVRRLAEAVLDVPAGDERVSVVTEGDPAEVIARQAEALRRCVVCTTTNGRGRLRGALVGSVARSLVQRVDPIVALGPMADNPGWSPRPRAWPEPLSIPRIVACVDGSDASEQILPVASAWAQALAMSLTIVTAVPDEPEPLDASRASGSYGGAPDAASYVEELAQRWGAGGLEVDSEVLRSPIGPPSAIRAHLDERPAGLVALTSHARSGMERVRFGAAAAGIVHASVAPCLVTAVRR